MSEQALERRLRHLQVLSAVVLAVCAVYLGVLLLRSGRVLGAATQDDTHLGGWPELISNGLVVGDSGAPHTVVVFTDYMCELCRAYEGVLENVRRLHPTEVKTVYYLYPLRTIHPESERIGLGVLCASRQAGVESLHTELMRRDPAMPVDLVRDSLAREIVPDLGLYSSCMTGYEAVPELAEHMRLGFVHNLRLLPAVFVNGVQFPVAPSEQMLTDMVAD